MIVKEMVFSGLGAKQYTHFFNRENNTVITVFTEDKEGISFAEFDFGDIDINLALSFMYKMGELQEWLRNESELLLPIDKYPLPKKGAV